MLHSSTPSLTRIVHICMSGVGGECGLEYDVCVDCGLWIVGMVVYVGVIVWFVKHNVFICVCCVEKGAKGMGWGVHQIHSKV